jgi:hypothetical protein
VAGPSIASFTGRRLLGGIQIERPIAGHKPTYGE